MKTFGLFTAALIAASGAARAAAIESMSAELEKAGISVSAGAHQQPPKPGLPAPVHNVQPGYHPQPGQPGYNPHPQPWPGQPGYNPTPWNPGYPDPNPNPWNPQPWPPYNPPVNPGYPTHPQPYPGQPPYSQTQEFRFESGSFVFSSDADESRLYAVAALRRAGHVLLEQRDNVTRYSLVFRAPSYHKVERYESGAFVFGSEAKQAADECVRALERQGKVILEKNVQGTRFTVSYLGTVWQGQSQNQTYQSGSFVFSSEARESMEAAAEALKRLGAVIIEKRQAGTSYTIVFQAYQRLEFQTYQSGAYVFSSDAKEGLELAAAALERAGGTAVVERRQNGTRFTVVFVSREKIRTQKYESGAYTFSSEAKQAAEETAAAFASQGFIVLEKNVQGTRFTVTYFSPGYQYPY